MKKKRPCQQRNRSYKEEPNGNFRVDKYTDLMKRQKGISELEGRKIDISNLNNRQKIDLKNEQSFRTCEIITKDLIFMSSESQRRGKNRVDLNKVFEELMAENSPNLASSTDSRS